MFCKSSRRKTCGEHIQLAKVESTKHSLLTVRCSKSVLICEYKEFATRKPKLSAHLRIKTEQVVLSDSDPRHDIGTVAYLRIQEARLVPSSKSTEPLSSVPVPSLLDDEAQELYKALIGFDVDIGRSNANHVPSVSSTSNISEEISSSTSGPWISIGNLTSRRKSPEAQAKECFQLLKGVYRV